MMNAPRTMFPLLDALADVLATIDDLREELPVESPERAEWDAIHADLDAIALRCAAREIAVKAGAGYPP